MQEFVVRGIVEVMDDRQVTDRSRGMSAALSRLTEARQARGPVDLELLQVVDLDDIDEALAEAPSSGRRGFFRFRDRARNAID